MSHNPRAKDDTRDDQIITLLNQIGERLIRGEKDRIAVKSSLQRYDEIYSELESRAANSERAYLSLQNKVSRTADLEAELREWQARIEEEQKYQAEKLARAEAITLKIEEAMAHQDRMNRRLEKIIKDRAQLARKVERIEDTVIETRDALNAKAMVLLTDENLATKTAKAALPTAPAEKAKKSQTIWDKPFYLQAAGITALIIIAISSAWAISRMPGYSLDNAVTKETPVTVREIDLALADADPANIMETEPEILETQFEADPAALAAQLNQMEPGAGPVPEDMQQLAASAKPATNEPEAVIKPVAFTPAPAAIDTFDTEDFVAAEQSSKPLAERVQPDPDLPPVIKEVEAKAFEGVAEAQHDLAAIYTAGHGGVKINYEKAALWFKEASLQGIANARYNLGVLYHQGLGVNKDVSKAVGWYRAAAELSHPEAQYNLGIAYVEGIGTGYSPPLAARYFQQAALSGIVEAAYNLGLIHENALLGEQDLKQALFWYKHAASQGSPEAQTALNQLAEAMKMDSADVEKLYEQISKGTLGEKAAGGSIMGDDAQPADIGKQTSVNTKPSAAAANKQAAMPASDAPVISEAIVPKENNKIILVAQIQEQLMREGLYPGPANGTLSPQTEDAIRSYQSKNRLTSDGRASQALLIHMMARDIPDVSPAAESTPEKTAEIVPGALTQDDLLVP